MIHRLRALVGQRDLADHSPNGDQTMAHYELDEDQRARVQHALAKDEADLKKLKKDNAAEGLDVRDVEAKLSLLRGDKGGKPGLIQIFSNQTEVFSEPGSDAAQLSIDDALDGKQDEGATGTWSDWVPEPKPKPGDLISILNGDGNDLPLTVVDVLGFEQRDGSQKKPKTDNPYEVGSFSVFAVTADRAQGYTPEDKRKVYIVPDTSESGTEWAQIESPPVDVSAIRAAAEAGEAEDFEGAPGDGHVLDHDPFENEDTITDLEDFGKHGDQESASSPPTVAPGGGNNSDKPRGRKRAAAGNLAGAVKKEVARATGESKHRPRGKK